MDKFEEELLELLPKEAIIELFKQRIVLTEDELAEVIENAIKDFFDAGPPSGRFDPKYAQRINSHKKPIREYSGSKAASRERFKRLDPEYRAEVNRYYRERYARKKAEKEAMKNEQ